MRYRHVRYLKIDQFVRGVGSVMAAVFVMSACAGSALADMPSAPAGVDAQRVAVLNDRDSLLERWESHPAVGLQFTGTERENVKDAEVVEEVRVFANPRRAMALELEKQRLERARQAMYAELRLLERDAEDVAWRQADPDLESPESRLNWGYSPQAEYRMRSHNDAIHALPTDQVQPASLIRIAF